MNEEIENILKREELRIEEEDCAHGFRGYVTGPRGMWEIHLEGLMGMPVEKLVAFAKESGYKDVGALKVIHDAYVSIAAGYLAQRKEDTGFILE